MSTRPRFSVEKSIATTAAFIVAMAAKTIAQSATSSSSFPGTFINGPRISRDLANRECLALGDNMFEPSVREVGSCRAMELHEIGRVGPDDWWYADYHRRWLLTPSDTVAEIEVVLFSRHTSRDALEKSSASLQPVWHYRYEPEMLPSVTPEVVSVAGKLALLAIQECVNGTGGCTQSFATYTRSSARPVKLTFLDSLNRRFPGGIWHGFHVDVRTMRGSVALYSPSDANCCPSTIGEFSVRLKNNALELTTLRLRRGN